jgi:hypothetical protein
VQAENQQKHHAKAKSPAPGIHTAEENASTIRKINSLLPLLPIWKRSHSENQSASLNDEFSRPQRTGKALIICSGGDTTCYIRAHSQVNSYHVVASVVLETLRLRLDKPTEAEAENQEASARFLRLTIRPCSNINRRIGNDLRVNND